MQCPKTNAVKLIYWMGNLEILRGIAQKNISSKMEMLGGLSTVGFYDHTDPVPLQVHSFWYCILLRLAENSNPTELHNTENEFLISTDG